MNKKIFRIKGKIIKKYLIHKSKKEGKDTKRTVIYNFEKEITGTSEKDVLEKIFSFFGSVYKVKRSCIKIDEIKEISADEIKSKILKKFIEKWK